MSEDDIAALNAQVATLETTIQAAFEQLQIVKTQRRALEARLRSESSSSSSSDSDASTPPSSAFTAGIHTLPVELLIKIFTSAVHGVDRTSCITDAQDAFLCAVSISHVCRLWRGAALQTSSLWTYVQFGGNLRGVRTCLGRANTQPLTIVRAATGHELPTLPEKTIALKSHLEATASRWMHVHWISSDITMRHILTELNRVSVFPFLTTLDLVVDERRLVGPRFVPFIPDFSQATSPRFPLLEHMKLIQVPPSDFPPVDTPSLRTLYLHFPHKQLDHREWSHLLRMSSLCALLYRAPELEELAVDDSIILMDIRLRPFGEPDPGPPVDPGARHTHLNVSPVTMHNLTRFQWDFAPARDLWRLFYFVRMPCLRQLDIVLDRSDERWLQVRGGIVSAVGNIQPVAEFLTHPVVRFDHLEDLRVECLDTDGLAMAFRKLEFPNLKSMSLTFVELNVPNSFKYNRATLTPEISSQLPRAESIFRDPRMLNLVSLELTRFHLDGPHTKGMLQYMPVLARLSLDSCKNAGQLIRALNAVLPPAAGIDVDTRAQEEWVCPALEHLALRHCDDVAFVDLCLAVCQRKSSSLVEPGVGARKRAFIPLRTRKRAKYYGGGGEQEQLLASPAKTAVRASPPSSVPGAWSSHERKKPKKLRTLCVEACKGLGEDEIDGIRMDVEEVIYVPAT